MGIPSFVVKVEGLEPAALTGLVARACFLSGQWVQSFVLQGAGYVKFGKGPILSRQEEFPDFLLVLGTANLNETLRHAKEKSVVIVNSAEKPKAAIVKKRRLRLYAIDATGMALSALGKPEPDVPMLGAFVKYCDKVTARAARLAVGEGREMLAALDEGMRSAK